MSIIIRLSRAHGANPLQWRCVYEVARLSRARTERTLQNRRIFVHSFASKSHGFLPKGGSIKPG